MNALKLDAIMEAMQQVEQDLRDYKWMSEKVAEYSARNHDDEIGVGISQYGVEAALPKANSISDPTAREAQRILREQQRIKRYDEKLRKIDQAVAEIKDERERAVAEAIMDGDRLYMIAQQINVSRTTAYELRKSVIRKLAFSLYQEAFN